MEFISSVLHIFVFKGFTDANYLSCFEIQHFSIGYLIKLSCESIDCSNKLESNIFYTIIKAKYKALSKATKEVIYLQKFLTKLHILFPSKISEHSLNKSI